MIRVARVRLELRRAELLMQHDELCLRRGVRGIRFGELRAVRATAGVKDVRGASQIVSVIRVKCNNT